MYTYAENPKKPGEKPGFLKILQKIISLDLLKTFLAVIELVPDDDFSFFEGFLNINNPSKKERSSSGTSSMMARKVLSRSNEMIFCRSSQTGFFTRFRLKAKSS